MSLRPGQFVPREAKSAHIGVEVQERIAMYCWYRGKGQTLSFAYLAARDQFHMKYPVNTELTQFVKLYAVH